MHNNKKQKTIFEYFSSPRKKIQTNTENISFLTSENEMNHEESINSYGNESNEKKEFNDENSCIIGTDDQSQLDIDKFNRDIKNGNSCEGFSVNLSGNSFEFNISEDNRDKNDSNRNQKTPISLKDSSYVDTDRFTFLIDVKDKEMRRKDDPEYDPSTLYIPSSYYKKFTPFEKQYWDIKKEYFDTIICFKKGKFYELYENDAEIGAKYFDLKITDRVNMKMVGFPEKSFDHWASKFLEKGFKIARVDQKENMIGKNIRKKEEETNFKNKKTEDKIIHRELKEVITQGTIYNSDHLKSHFSIYTAVIKAANSCYKQECDKYFHISLILYDASVNTIFHSSFCENQEFSNLKTLFAKYDIKEVITDINLKMDYPFILLKPISDKSEISNKFKFSNETEYECFNYLVNYMKYLKRDEFIKNINISFLNENNNNDFLVLDSTTLKNLEILNNNYDLTTEKSLFSVINFCNTPGGTRLLRKWLMNPLRNPREIYKRQNITVSLDMTNIQSTMEYLKTFGDLERIIGKLFSGNPNVKDLKIFLNYLNIFCKTIESLRNEIIKSVEKYKNDDKIFYNYFFGNIIERNNISEESLDLLNLSCSFSLEETFKYEKNGFIEIYTLLGTFDHEIKNVLNNFNSNYTINDKEISPGDTKNDEICILFDKMVEIENNLKSYLKNQKTNLKNSDITYKNIGKEIFQLDVPNNLKIPENYILVSTTKNTKRYYTHELKELINEYLEIEEKIFQSRGSLLRRAVDSLSIHIKLFYQISSLISHIDCYFSFSMVSKTYKNFNFPIISDKLEILDMKNPIFLDYIPNDLNLKDNRFLVLTGPNMGGKSTFLRSSCLLLIMAHVGLKVPCKNMEFPIFDRIFTRIGASDDLSKGKSTFMVEMSETAKILNEATHNSFVIIDELGRGTSTVDGERIACSVIKYLTKKNIYTLFSTHYHKIIDNISGVNKSFMKAIVDKKDIIFTYKLVDGICYDSHGISVARMAGVPESIIKRAIEIKNANYK